MPVSETLQYYKVFTNSVRGIGGSHRNVPNRGVQAEQIALLRRLHRAFRLGGTALVLVGLTFVWLFWLSSRSVEWVMETERTRRMAIEARNHAVDRNASIRGFLLSKQQVSLGPELIARAPLAALIDTLLVITEGNESQHDRVKTIAQSIERWERGWAMPALATANTDSATGHTALAGKELFDSIRSAFDSFLAGESRIYTRRVGMQTSIRRITYAAIIMELLVLIGVLAWLGKRSYRNAREIFGTVEQLKSAELIAHAARSQQQEAQGLLDFVLDNSPVGVSLHDRDLKLVRMNKVMAAMIGAPVDEHAGKTLNAVMSAEMVDTIQPLLERVLASGAAITNVPVTGPNPDDRLAERHFLWSFFPVSLPGRSGGVGSVVLETTQYRKLEEQLLQAQKMEAVGRLAGGVAHDFNNMLTAIRSYSELLLADMEPGTLQHADMMEVINAAVRATALTKKLLAFSRQQVLRPARVDLNLTIGGIRKMLERIAGKKVELTCNLLPALWPVSADPTEIERVITNLVLNAHDAMPEGGRLIIETSNVYIDDEYVSTHADVSPGSYVMLAVTDTGTGMTKEVREKLFEPFFTTKEKGKGTGLGLPSVYGIVKQSGGFVWVYSEPDKGTTFKVYLPRALPEEAIDHVRTPRGNKAFGPETILLVEDDEEVRHVALRILRNNGYRVLEAVNGADALRVCEAEGAPVDLVVTDIVMPEMGGSELAERIREAQPDARILFTSGFTEDAAVRQSFLHSGESFIEKPFTPASLAKKAREVLDGVESDDRP